MISRPQQISDEVNHYPSNSEGSVVEIKREPPLSRPLEFVGMFITRALEKIAAEKQTRKASNGDLREACQKGIKYLRERVKLPKGDSKLPKAPEGYIPPTQSQGEALLSDEKLLVPFELACKSRSPKVVAIALDCLQKLIAFGHVPNNAYDSSGQTRIIERIVQIICSCFNGLNTDDDVQLQVIKALLTIVTSPVVEVHERYILLVVRTCYDIYMATRNLVNQTTARATLTQMLNVIFQRMEQATLDAEAQHDQKLSEMKNKLESVVKASVDESKDSVTGALVDESHPQTLNVENIPEGDGAERNESGSRSGSPTLKRQPLSGDFSEDPAEKMVDVVKVNGHATDPGKESDVVTSSDKEPMSTPDLSSGNEPEAVNSYSEEENLKANGDDDEVEEPNSVSNQSNGSGSEAENFSSKGEELKGSECNNEAKTVSEENASTEEVNESASGVDSVEVDKSSQNSGESEKPPEERVEEAESKTVQCAASTSSLNTDNFSGSAAVDSSDEVSSSDYDFAHISQKDAFLVFRSLCRLAMKPLTGTVATDLKSHGFRSKILSLQLLLSILQNPGPAFRSNSVFITAIRQYLCVALSNNGASSVPEVFESSLTIFLALLTHFKQHLKIQIEVFFKEMLFAVLDSPSSSFEHKRIVVEAMQRICMDKQCIVDAYLNYDCDLERENIFEKLVICLSKVAQGRPAVDARTTQPQLQDLRNKGLECLVLILRCMVRWSGDLFHVTNDTQSFLGSEPKNADGKEHDTDSGSSVRLHQSAVPDDPEAFESRKALKSVFEEGIYQFNRGKITKALALLQDNGLLGTSAEEVAMFLHNESRLCRTAIGDFLGEHDTFALEVMYAYVDCFDFSGIEFLPALRLFLSGFWLPGEAQKIDRLMEKFAARYCACNPSNTLFASADTAYVLAYSIIMLTTDLHSVKIKQKQKMSKEDYIKMNRGINDSQDLSREYLGKIYDEIAHCGIEVRSDNPATSLANSSSSTNLIAGGGMTPGIRDYKESVAQKENEFTSATHFEHVRPMFKLVWTPFLAAFSVGLQDCDDVRIAHHCLEGIQCAVRIACTFRMELERDAYVQALARFTLLLSTSQSHSSHQFNGASAASNTLAATHPSAQARARLESGNSGGSANTFMNSVAAAMEVPAVVSATPETMKSKNVDSIRTLIAVAQTDGNYLGHSWLHILRCISQLESANVIATNTARSLPHQQRHGSPGSGAGHDESQSGGGGGSKGMRRRSGLAPGSLAAATVDSRKAAVLQEVMGETGSRSVVVAVDKIFSGSVRLDGDAIEDFVQALCQVSLEELSLPQPRTFSLQKVVEISYYNIGRIRLQWSRIWEHIGQHFTTAGCSNNQDVAIFAVDSLRQLAVKLIEKGELPNFHFQKECIRPFLNILEATTISGREVAGASGIEDMVVRCVAQLIQSQWTNIRSGWTNLFLVLYTAAASSDSGVIELAFGACAFVVNNVFPNYFYLLVDSFPVFIKTLAEFACNLRFSDTSMEAIRLIRQCARVVSERSTQFAKEVSAATATAKTAGEASNEATQQQDMDGSGEKENDEEGEGDDADAEEEECEEALWRRGWMPILYELFRVINNCMLDVRTRGLTVFFEVIKSYGSTFCLSWWVQIFKLIFSIFEHGRDTSSTPVTGVDGGAAKKTQPSVRQNTGSLRRQRLFSGDHMAEAFGITYRHFSSSTDRSEWLNTTCNHALYSVVDVFSQFFDRIGDALLPSLYEQLKWCCLQDHEQLARSGTSCFETIVNTNGPKFDSKKWTMTVDLLVDLFRSTVPHELLTWRPDPIMDGADSGADEATLKQRQSARTRLFLRLLVDCYVQFELIQTVDNMLFVPSRSRLEDSLILRDTRASSFALNLPQQQQQPQQDNGAAVAALTQAHTPEEKRLFDAVGGQASTNAESSPLQAPVGLGSFRETEELVNGSLPLDKKATFPYISYENRIVIIKCLMESHRFAKTFNSNIEQRNILWEAGFKVKAKPNLLKQETHSLATALRILFRISEEDRGHQEEVTKMLQDTISEAITYYRSLPMDGHRQAWDSCLLLMLTRLVHLNPETRFRNIATPLYLPVCDLVGLPNLTPEVLVLLRAFLLRMNGPSSVLDTA